MRRVGIEGLDGVASLLAENESLRAQVERITQELASRDADLKACRDCASHFKWVIKRQRQQLEGLRSR